VKLSHGPPEVGIDGRLDGSRQLGLGVEQVLSPALSAVNTAFVRTMLDDLKRSSNVRL